MRRLKLALFAGFAAIALLGPSPAAASTELSGLLLDPPAAGYTALTVPPAVNGAVTEEGIPAPAGYAPGSGSAFVGGWGKTFVRGGGGDLLISVVGEYTSEMAAKDGARKTVERAEAEGAVPFDIGADIPTAHGMTMTQPQGVTNVTVVAIEFRYGRHVFALASISPSPGMTPAEVTALAEAQYRHAVANLPKPAGRSIAYVIGYATLPLLAMAALVFAIVRWTRARRAPSPYAPPPYAPSPYAPAASPAPSDWDHAWAPPRTHSPAGDAAFAPPAASVTESTFATAAVAVAPAPTPVPARIESRPCPSCSNDFGSADTCQSCGALRTECAVCGVKIWAGAMTCATHSGLVR